MGANHTTVQPTAQHNTHPIGGVSSAASAVSTAILLLGRFLFAVIFLLSAPMHFSQADIAEGAAHGVPAAALLVPLSGLLAAAGALSIFLAYKPRVGAWLLVLFLVPVTFVMHNFWSVQDPSMAALQLAMFMKNISMLGGALLITQFGAGPKIWNLRANLDR